MIEEWRDIEGYECLYQVSNFGQVRSKDREVKAKSNGKRNLKGRILKLQNHWGGYKLVGLRKNQKLKTFKVHRLVAETFIPNPKIRPQVNHIDENKENNKVSNLEWCTRLYNVNHGTGIKRRSLTQSKPIVQLSLLGDFIRNWGSAGIAEKELGFNKTNIAACCRGERKTHKGFKWKYKENHYV